MTREMSQKEVLRFAKMASSRARERWGAGWATLSPAMRADVISARIPEIAFAWDNADGISAASVTAIWLEALKLEGLHDL